MEKSSKKSKQIIYFIGIGGIGMSSLARWFKAHGYDVTGSDITASATTRELQDEGLIIKIGPHVSQNISGDISKVIYNQAITKDNPELKRAAERGIPCISYPQSLGELTKIYKTIAIAGAHGKSTTTSLISLIMEKAKLDPTVIVGTKLKEFNKSNFKNGKSEYLIIEADEWKASFLNYFPYAALITNIDREHLDFYKNLTNIKKTFEKFLYNVNPYGLIVLNKDNVELVKISKKIRRPVVWYSLKSPEADQIRKIIKVPGEHNVSNALGAYTLARALGIHPKTILASIAEYRGVWRRSEYRGALQSAKVYDDYGHHPTEISATLTGFKQAFPRHRLICVFQPHQRERLKLLFKDFVSAFKSADELILLQIYSVAGREEKENKINSQKLADAVSADSGKSVVVLSNLDDLKSTLKNTFHISNNDIIIMMGAGNINEWTDKLISK